MFYNNINPVITHIGVFEIRWYGVLFALGALLAYIILRRLAKEKGLELSENDIADFMLYELAGIIMGARAFSIISEPAGYISNPLEAFALWHGGLAFHGGLIGALVAGYIFCKRKKADFWEMADITIIAATTALIFGRIGNFINGEFYGIKTAVPWGVYFNGAEGARHPVQLYEAAKNLLIFGILWNIRNKKLPKGTIFWTFTLSYGTLRFALESFKDLPHPYLGLTWGQAWCLPMILMGAVMLAWKYKQINTSKN